MFIRNYLGLEDSANQTAEANQTTEVNPISFKEATEFVSDRSFDSFRSARTRFSQFFVQIFCGECGAVWIKDEWTISSV